MAIRFAPVSGWSGLTIAAALLAIAGVAYVDLSGQHATGLQPNAAKWASLMELDVDLLTICKSRDQSSGQTERPRRARSPFIHCRGE